MNTDENADRPKPIKKPHSNSIKKKSLTKKLDPETGKLLQQLREKANRKNFGRRVRDNQILNLALGLVTSEHLQGLQDAALSERDRLRIAHEEHCKEFGKITLDHFLGLLMRGEIKPSPPRNSLSSEVQL
jgi:hypothetical protein